MTTWRNELQQPRIRFETILLIQANHKRRYDPALLVGWQLLLLELATAALHPIVGVLAALVSLVAVSALCSSSGRRDAAT